MNEDIYKVKRGKRKEILFSFEQEQKIIELYKSHNSLKNISDKFNVSPYIIRRILRKNEIKILGQRNRFPLNEDYFSIIDIEEKAYWLGFLYADGCVHDTTNEISITLKDKEHLEKFKKAIDSCNNIGITVDTRFKKECIIYHFSVRSKKIKEDLIKLGCVTQKTLKLNYVPNIPKKLLFSFIRGYFDGDGSLHYTTSYKNTNHKDYRISFVGTYNFINQIRDILNLSQKVLKNGNGNSYVFQVNGNKQVFSVLNKLYFSSTEKTRLDRKYNIYLNLCKDLGASPLNLEI